jgi:hypothetical protein
MTPIGDGISALLVRNVLASLLATLLNSHHDGGFKIRAVHFDHCSHYLASAPTVDRPVAFHGETTFNGSKLGRESISGDWRLG